jgi:pyruvate,water dikinase
MPDLEIRMACYREVLQANNAALGFVTRIQEALAGERPVGGAESRRLVAGVTVQTYRMISNLNRMTGERFPVLLRRFHDLRKRISGQTEVTPYLGGVGFVVPLGDVSAEMAEVVGQKSAFLGEARRLLPGQVPDGFATTEPAYREFIDGAGLASRVGEVLETLDPSEVAASFSAAARIAQMIESAPVPPRLAAELGSAAAALGAKGSRLAVRSSALQEGGLEVSFAGQYRSLLNVPASGIVDAFRQVVASKYSPQALTYRLGRGLEDREVAMCCCVLTMLDAASAGVLYSACRTEAGVVTLLQAVRGLGLSAVDGSAVPDSVLLDRKTARVVGRTAGWQETLLACAAGEGTEAIEVANKLRGVPILPDEQALAVARLAWRLEDHLGMPIDMEWALDRQGRAFVLQVRPQPEHAGETWRAPAPRVAAARVLIERGSRASGGVGCGDAHRVQSDLDILRFPAGGVLVSSEANPRLAVLLPKAAAVVADRGEVTGHLATVARELGVPALFATDIATAVLEDSARVTVDADAGVVYEGRVEQALARGRAGARAGRTSPARERLASVADLIVPLTLRDRLASGYSPRKCRTLHDMIRFCHQAAVEAMFALGDGALRQGTPVYRLVSNVPIDCRLFDLGGGLREGAGPGDVTIDDVVSVPLRALLKGMTDPRLRWRMTRPVSVSGFLSAVVNYNYDEDVRVRAMGEPSYVFITSDYMNLNSRVGYHFSTVDARVGEPVESNYASFRFVGGSTGVDQRSRRAVLIQRILARHGFETDCRADLVNARVRHRPAEEMVEALVLVGLLTGFVNHLDMALTSDHLVTVFEEAFQEGHYGFKGEVDGG